MVVVVVQEACFCAPVAYSAQVCEVVTVLLVLSISWEASFRLCGGCRLLATTELRSEESKRKCYLLFAGNSGS